MFSGVKTPSVFSVAEMNKSEKEVAVSIFKIVWFAGIFFSYPIFLPSGNNLKYP